MALDLTGAASDNATKGNFRVTIPGVDGEMRFTEVDAPEIKHMVAKQWQGGRATPTIIASGKREAEPVTFKRGLMKAGSQLWTVFAAHATGADKTPKTVVVEVLGADHTDVLHTFRLTDGIFSGYKGTDLNAENAEDAAVEEVTFIPEDYIPFATT